MRCHHRSTWRGALAAFTLCAGGAVQADTTPAREPGLFLFQRISSPAAEPSMIVSVDLAPGTWRIGHLDGPPANEEQLRAVLDQLQGIILDASCRDGAQTLPHRRCSFALGAPQFAGISSRQGSVLGWVATGGATAAGSVARWFGLLVPHRYVTPESTAFGAGLALRFLIPPRDLVAATFDDVSVVLHNDARGSLATLADPVADRIAADAVERGSQ